jgi:hypothetical protein
VPAINPERLAQEVNDVKELIGNPPKLRWRVLDILDFYADRTRRSPASLRPGHADKKFGVPRPVLNALERGLKESTQEHPELRTTVSEELWRMDYRETRYLAITLLETRPLEEILNVVESWSLETKDYELLRKLALTLVTSWKKDHFRGFSSASTKWLKGQQIPLKLFAMLTFQSAVDDPDFSDVPLIFRFLRVYDFGGIPEINRAVSDLIRSLSQRSEAESARFLLDLLEKDAPTGRKLIRSVMECFSPDQQLRLKHALST